MTRPVKCRRISGLPGSGSFTPEDVHDGEPIVMMMDEFEVLRLLDYEGLTQEECAARMNVSRTTVTAICQAARYKAAQMLVEGRKLVISGGCCRYVPADLPEYRLEKGEGIMRIAVAYGDGEVFQHFGRTEKFRIYDIEDGKVLRAQTIGTDGQGHGALAGVLMNAGVDALICGGIGMGARNALEYAGIRLYPGIQGSADAAVEALLSGTLDYDPDTQCDHHDHAHEDCGHDHCGHHGEVC